MATPLIKIVRIVCDVDRFKYLSHLRRTLALIKVVVVTIAAENDSGLEVSPLLYSEPATTPIKFPEN